MANTHETPAWCKQNVSWVMAALALTGPMVKRPCLYHCTQRRGQHQTHPPSATRQQKANVQRKEWQLLNSALGRSWSWTGTAMHASLFNVAATCTTAVFPTQTSIEGNRAWSCCYSSAWSRFACTIENTAWWTKERKRKKKKEKKKNPHKKTQPNAAFSLCHTCSAITIRERGNLQRDTDCEK